MPCVQERERQRRADDIRANRRDVDLFAGVTDPVEMIKIIHRPRAHNPLENLLPFPRSVESLYTELTTAESASLVAYTTERAELGEFDTAEDMARCLVSFTGANLDTVLEAFLRQEKFYPGIVFRRASIPIRDALIGRIDADNANKDHLLVSLAWIGDTKVVELFAQWQSRPPSWASQLHVPPEDYAREAGWELSSSRERRDLFHKECYELVPRVDATVSPVSVVAPGEEACGWCGRRMVALVSLDLTAEELAWLPINGTGLAVHTCASCTCYGPVFTDTRDATRPSWHPGNARPEYLPEEVDAEFELPADKLVLSKKPRGTFHAADQFLPTRFSQIGGHPTWIQDAEYPTCPDCRARMVFVAQVDSTDIEEYGEGVYYGFACFECRVAATTFQQT